MLDVSGISVIYGAHRALEDAAVRVDAGEIVVILGANGAGKSSLLKAIAGTSEGKVQGNVQLDGADLTGLPAEVIVVRGISFVPEGRGIFGDLTVAENLMLGAHATEARAHQEKNLSRVYELFPKLKERAGQVARTMSGGEQQMVAIGRAIMANPKILMLDEPSLGLSPLLCKELFQNLSHIRDTGIGVLMVEQNAKQSLAISDRAYLLENGTITSEDTAKNMMDDPAVQTAYLGGARGAASPTNTHGKPKIKTHIITPDEADHTLQTAPPSASPQRYIQPLPAGELSGVREQVAGIDIGSLVDRASDIAVKQHVSVSSASAPRLSNTPAASTTGAIHGTSMPSGNSDVQKLLADFETAANEAQKSRHSTSNEIPSHGHINIHPVVDDENLPKIPVFRRTKLEVYRRAPGGELMRVKEK